MTKHINLAYSLERESLVAAISYYKNGYFPEMREYSGINQYQYVERLEEKLEELDYNYKIKLYSPSLSILANAIRIEAQRCYEIADTSQIKIYWLRKVIVLLKDLKTLVPELEVYSNMWLAKRTNITLKAV
jgi:hypothetical protein